MFLDEMKDAVYCIEFIYPPGMVPQSIPLTNVSRKMNSLLIYFKNVPTLDDIARIVKIIDSPSNNPAKAVTDKVGGLKYKCYTKVMDRWEDA